MFSRIRVSTHCRMFSKSRIAPKSFPQNRAFHVSLRTKDVTSKINYLGCFSSSSVFNTNFVRFASTNETPNVPTQEVLPLIPDAPVIPPEISEVIGEASLESLGLGGYLPIGLTQHCLYWLHSTCGLPWWATLIVGTATIKIMLMPLFLKMQRHKALSDVYRKDLSYFDRKRQEASEEGDSMRANLYVQKQDKFFANHNMMTSKKSLINYAIQGSVFCTFFMAMRGMTNAPVPSMREGGFGWFSDLTVADPYYILPLFSTACGALFMYLSPPPAVGGVNMTGFQKYLKYVVPAIVLPFMIYLKAGVLLYIITSTNMTFICHGLLRVPKIRSFCKVAPVVKFQDGALTNKNNASFIQSVKSSWKSIRQRKAISKVSSLDIKQFQSAGRGPLIKTYKFDPTKVMVAKK